MAAVQDTNRAVGQVNGGEVVLGFLALNAVVFDDTHQALALVVHDAIGKPQAGCMGELARAWLALRVVANNINLLVGKMAEVNIAAVQPPAATTIFMHGCER